MNTRCYRCGWSFSLSREEIETAVAAAMASGEKVHAERCPRCRQVIKLPLDQLRRALPAGWTPADHQATTAPEVEAQLEPAPTAEAEAEPAENAAPKPRRHRRSSGGSAPMEAAEQAVPKAGTRPGKPAAGSPATKKTARKQSKP